MARAVVTARFERWWGPALPYDEAQANQSTRQGFSAFSPTRQEATAAKSLRRRRLDSFSTLHKLQQFISPSFESTVVAFVESVASIAYRNLTPCFYKLFAQGES